MLRKLGFRHEGTRRGHHWNPKRGVAEDIDLWGLLKTDLAASG